MLALALALALAATTLPFSLLLLLASDASRKRGGVYGVRDGCGAGSSDVAFRISGDGRRYPIR